MSTHDPSTHPAHIPQTLAQGHAQTYGELLADIKALDPDAQVHLCTADASGTTPAKDLVGELEKMPPDQLLVTWRAFPVPTPEPV